MNVFGPTNPTVGNSFGAPTESRFMLSGVNTLTMVYPLETPRSNFTIAPDLIGGNGIPTLLPYPYAAENGLVLGGYRK